MLLLLLLLLSSLLLLLLSSSSLLLLLLLLLLLFVVSACRTREKIHLFSKWKNETLIKRTYNVFPTLIISVISAHASNPTSNRRWMSGICFVVNAIKKYWQLPLRSNMNERKSENIAWILNLTFLVLLRSERLNDAMMLTASSPSWKQTETFESSDLTLT